ncbi:5'-nucleotidase [Sporolactobacillus pectinivorans]|uniref:5'-nucleotidase n=1 Tax=Sporolactobacillus pectinivorans TaxID=1591408 RepID=UPI000C2611FE|nr:5'-nucleotidase [Sporolactobacillus pectinivorans]
MSYKLEDKLVVAIASSALFDLKESDKVFREKGEEEYRKYQRKNEDKTLEKGVAFPLIKRLLDVNEELNKTVVEVILLSRNDPDTGLRVFKSIEHYSLNISRAIFVTGRNPFKYMKAINASLFLSGNLEDVKEAVRNGYPAGHVHNTNFADDSDDKELRLAFDFDGVIADDSAEQVLQNGGGLSNYQKHERDHAEEPLPIGPLYDFLKKISAIQNEELQRQKDDANFKPLIRIAICTARNSPAHERTIKTFRDWRIRIDEAFFLGGINKMDVLNIYRPHIFFDDMMDNIQNVEQSFPSVHVPYGIKNRETDTLTI